MRNEMRAVSVLPEGYTQIYSVDLQKDKKMAILINLLAMLIAVVMVVPMCFYIPITELFSVDSGLGAYFLRVGVMLGGMIVYIILHELTHAVVMRYYGAQHVKFGFTGLYAYAGSPEDYFHKVPYIIISMAPLALWGLIFLVINMLVPRDWFWVVYILQIANVSGAAGDLFVAGYFSRMPSDILVRDTGVGMTVFSREVSNE